MGLYELENDAVSAANLAETLSWYLSDRLEAMDTRGADPNDLAAMEHAALLAQVAADGSRGLALTIQEAHLGRIAIREG